jgi:hypothetical protein
LAVEYTGSIHITLILKPLDQTIVPPRSQAFQRLDYVVAQKVPLWCDELLCTAKARSHSQDVIQFSQLPGISLLQYGVPAAQQALC